MFEQIPFWRLNAALGLVLLAPGKGPLFASPVTQADPASEIQAASEIQSAASAADADVRQDAKSVTPKMQKGASEDRKARKAELWLEQLASPDYEKRQAAVKKLQAMGKRVVPLLQRTLKESDDAELRWQARRVLRRIQGGKRAGLESDRAKPDLVPERSRAMRRGRVPRMDFGPGSDLFRRLEEMQREVEEMARRLHGVAPRGPFDRGNPFDALRHSGKSGSRMERSESMRMRMTPEGVEVEVQGSENGKTKKQVYKAKTMGELLKKFPKLRGRLGGFAGKDGFRFEFPRIRVFGGPGAGSLRDFFGKDRLDKDLFDDDFFGKPFQDLRDTDRRFQKSESRGTKKRTAKRGSPRLEDDRDEPLPKAKNDGPKLGIYIREQISEDLRDYLGLEAGVGLFVEGLTEKGIAKELGIRRGDILVSLNGRKIRSARDVSAALSLAAKTKAVVIRKGKKRTLSR